MLKNISFVLIVLVGIGIMSFTTDIVVQDDFMSRTDEEGIYEPVVVLELFTSQGCSSCPSADVLLQEVKKKYTNEVFALS